MTNAELAILGLIVERPRHGYEIEAVIEERGMRDWTEIGFSSIYYILKKLEAEGLISSRLEQTPGRGPARKVHQITPQGQAAWRQGTLNAMSQPQRGNSQFLLGVAGMPALSQEETLIALRQYHAGLAQHRDQVHGRWQEGGEKLPLFLDGMFDYSVTLIEAEMSWIEGFIHRIETQAQQEPKPPEEKGN